MRPYNVAKNDISAEESINQGKLVTIGPVSRNWS